ncbi:MAG: hypothetical protein QM758_28535 [Armatimonas sp.]
MFFGPPAGGSSTPQKTLQSFVVAFNHRERRAMEVLVYNGKNNPALDVAFKNENEKPTILSVSSIKVKQITKSQVRVQYLLGALPPEGKPQKPKPEQLDMVKAGGKWLIIAPKPDTKSEPGNLANVATVLAYPEVLERATAMNKQTDARSNLRQVTTAALMHAIDNDEKYLLTQENYIKELTPYLKTKSVFTSPLDKPGTISFFFNTNLTGRTDASIKDPQNTVLFFEGKPEALNFRYSGKALVGFCDGSVRFIAPAEVKSLQWK